MTPPKTPDEEPGGDRPQTERQAGEQPAGEQQAAERAGEQPPAGGPGAPPPPQWLSEEQPDAGAPLPPGPPLPPFDAGEATLDDRTVVDRPRGDDDPNRSTQVFNPGTPPAIPPPPQSFAAPQEPPADVTVTDLSGYVPWAEKGADGGAADPAPAADPDSDRTSAFPAPEGAATQQFTSPEPAAGPAESPGASPTPPGPSVPEPFPYAQQIPGTPLPAPTPPATPPAPPAPASPPPPDPFPWAQEIPETPAAASPTPPPAPPRPAPEPFPWAQEIPGRPSPQPSPQPSPGTDPFPGSEPFPYAQPIPGQDHAAPPGPAHASPQPPGPGPAAPAVPPPLIDEPWRTEPKPKAKRKFPVKALLIGVGGIAAAALVAAGGFFVLNRDGGTSADDGTARLAGSLFALDPAARADGRDQQLTSAAAVGGTVVAVGAEADGRGGSRGQFLVSADGGRTFASATVEGDGGEPGPGELPRVVAGSAKGWIAIGVRPGGGAVWTSENGRNWRRQPDEAGQPFGANARVRRAAASDNGFLAFGETSQKGDFSDAQPAVWLSPDGARWEQRVGDRIGLPIQRGTISLLEVAGSGGVLLLEGLHTANPGARKPQMGRRVFSSDDGGRSWVESKVPVPKGTRGLMIGGGPSGFVAIREIQAGGKSYGQSFTSKDGMAWTQAGRVESSGYQRVSRVLGSDEGYAALVVRGRDVTISRTADGASWREAGTLPNRPGRALNGSAMSGGQTVLVGADNSGGELNSLLGVWDGQGTQVPIDIAKVPGAARPDHTVTAVGAGSDLAVAVGSANGDAGVWTSRDGTSWTRAQGAQGALSRPGPQQLVSVTGGKAGWLAVGSDQAAPRRPLVVTSTDGASWRAADSAGQFKPARNTPLATFAAASGPAGYVVVGEDGLSAATWFSADLKTWERGRSAGRNGLEALPNSNRWLRGVAAAQSGFVAVGGLRDASVGDGPAARPAVWTSADGRQWALQQLPLPGGAAEGALTHVAAKGDVVVAAGGTGATPLAYVSTDGGKTWKESKPPLPEDVENVQVTALTATPKGFAATGAGGRGSTDVVSWTSADGVSWKVSKPEGDGLAGKGSQSIAGLAAFKDRLLGVGHTAGQEREEPVLWTRPVP
ncbi:hypothetical protein GCM10023085_59250 [Actinomadura viridis]|uniref:Uncharacterized protein n=1 Tax=Actinomadura viridis TaxID=58110 RepID=A0A931DSY6_9ACTN|nr:sialidase family protein [Actinomadura viridis]MBG6093281.1 hypothetical protein [Actinomadura viridis]